MCCAFGPCGRTDEIEAGPGLVFWRGRYQCYLCYVLPIRFPKQPVIADRQRASLNPTRDGEPKLAGERQRQNLAFVKRRRVGPHR
jgi:hypothetical protein